MNPTIPSPTTAKQIQTIQWILNPTGYMQANQKRYGDLFRCRFAENMGSFNYMVSHPKMLQTIFSQDTGKLFSAPGDLNEILAPLLGYESVIMLGGASHRNRRQLLMPKFHGKILESYAKDIKEIALTTLSQWTDGGIIDVRTAMQKITMEVILRIVFGLRESERYQALDLLLSRRVNMTATPITSAMLFLPWLGRDVGPWSPGARANRLADAADALIFAEISERRSRPTESRSDVLSLLLSAKDEEGNGLTDQELRDELITLLFAGHETTATALTAALYWLHCGAVEKVDSRVLCTLREELDGLEQGSDAPSLVKLPYLAAVCQEALRIHPVAMLTFPRWVKEPVQCGGFILSPGDIVMGSIYLLHRREDLYPNPRKFLPERFINRQFTPYEFMPFGAGVRRCIGASLAQYELSIVLGTLLGHLDFNLVNSRPVGQARRGVTLGFDSPVRLRHQARRRPLLPPFTPSPQPLSPAV